VYINLLRNRAKRRLNPLHHMGAGKTMCSWYNC